MTSLKICATIPKCFQNLVLACPAVFRFHAGSLDVMAMLLHHYWEDCFENFVDENCYDLYLDHNLYHDLD
jgi:hypothetical protein